MKYTDYTEKECVLAQSFQNRIYKTNAEDLVFWHRWLAYDAEDRLKAENARFMLLRLAFSEKPVPEKEINRAWMDLQEAIRHRSSGCEK